MFCTTWCSKLFNQDSNHGFWVFEGLIRKWKGEIKLYFLPLYTKGPAVAFIHYNTTQSTMKMNQLICKVRVIEDWCGPTYFLHTPKGNPNGWWNRSDTSYRKIPEILSPLQNWVWNSLHQWMIRYINAWGVRRHVFSSLKTATYTLNKSSNLSFLICKIGIIIIAVMIR